MALDRPAELRWQLCRRLEPRHFGNADAVLNHLSLIFGITSRKTELDYVFIFMKSGTGNRGVLVPVSGRRAVISSREMIPTVSHDRNQETPEAKARWFQSLSLSDRMDLLCCFTDLALENNPELANLIDAESTSRRIRVIAEERR